MKKVVSRAMGSILILYVLIAVFGYITFADRLSQLNDEGNILMNDYKGQFAITVVIKINNKGI